MSILTRDRVLMRLLPVLFSFASFIIVMVALFAGNQPGILEQYDLLTVDISALSNNAVSPATQGIPLSARTTNSDCSGLGSILGQACESINSAASAGLPAPTSTVINPTNDNVNGIGVGGVGSGIGSGIADTETEQPYIPGFYSCYTMAICEGDFAADGSRMVTDCVPYISTGEAATIPALLLHALGLSSTNTPPTPGDTRPTPGDSLTALPALGLTYSLQSALAGLNDMLLAVAITNMIGIGCIFITTAVSLIAIWLSSDEDENRGYTAAVWVALVFTSASVFFLLLGGIVGAAGANAAVGKINGLGVDVGVRAEAGVWWHLLTWLPFALMALVVLPYWATRTGHLRRLRKAEKEAEAAAEEAEEEARSCRRSSRSRSHHRSRRRSCSCRDCRPCRR